MKENGYHTLYFIRESHCPADQLGTKARETDSVTKLGMFWMHLIMVIHIIVEQDQMLSEQSQGLR